MEATTQADPRTAARALSAAGAVVWRWHARERVVRTQGGKALGLPADELSLDALVALSAPADRAALETAFAPEAATDGLTFSLRLGSGARSAWRGRRDASGDAEGLAWTETALPPRPPRENDRLTGLLDRSAFARGLDARLGAGAPLRLVAADVRRFRRLNEGLGPARADHVLAALGARLAGAFAPARLPARIGEDEFAVVVEGDDAGAVERLRTALEAPLRVQGFDIHPKLACVEVVAAPGEDAQELLRRAALIGTTSGEGDAPGPAEAGAGALGRLELESDMRGALDRGELLPFYQPVVRLADGGVAGFEALVRWRHPRLGLLHPDEFLPLMGEAGLMGALSLHMIEASADQLGAWRRAHPRAGAITVGVNVTCGDLERTGLVDSVQAALSRAGLPRGALKLELTESEIMRDADRAAQVLGHLRDAGVAIAVDDFGMGFSSLSYLARLPLQALKIDRYFVRTMEVNEGSAKIVRSVISLGRDLGLEIVAEGVEDAAMARSLAALGCDYGQGFGYARPLPAQEAEVYLNESYLDGAPLRER